MTPPTTPKRARQPKGEPKSRPINRTLSENLQRIIDAEKSNPSAWAASHKAEKKQVQRALSVKTSPTLDTLAAIAEAADLQPWQLLVPNLDPSNPPVFAMTKTEAELYSRVKRDFASLPPANGG